MKIKYVDKPWESPCRNTSLPYDWVPIALDKNVQATRGDALAPLWHDGANPGQTDLYSGELRFTLTTRSPLLVGNQRLKLDKIDPNVRQSIEGGCTVRWRQDVEASCNAAKQGADNNRRRKQYNEQFETLVENHAEKSLLVPLRLGDDGPVLIPGESIKGMFRHAYGALLSAPMERVAEKTYSYRPNVVVPDPDQPPVCAPWAAAIESCDLAKLELKVKLIKPNLRHVEFVHDDECSFDPALPRAAAIQGLDSGTQVKNKRCFTTIRVNRETQQVQVGQGQGGRWKNDAGGQELTAFKTLWLRYHFGINGCDGYVKTGPSPNPRKHPSVLVPLDEYEWNAFNTSSVTVHPTVVRQYLETIAHLKDDSTGQRSRLSKDDQKKVLKGKFPDLQPGDLLFCEVTEVSRTSRTQKVIAFGHNFRYRWRHLNSVTQLTTAFEGGNWKTERRVEMRAHPLEKPSDPVQGFAALPPERLTAARNLFGYAVDENNPSFESGGHKGLASLRDPFNRLAGRVSFNFAIEWLREGDNEARRFVNADKGCFVFMHPTAEPKPSQSRSYVPGLDRTWGEGLRSARLKFQRQDPSGAMVDVLEDFVLLQGGTRNFAGRKFYLHQFDGRGQDRWALPPSHYNLEALYQKEKKPEAHAAPADLWELVQYLWGQHSAVARYMSSAGREFGFTVRFKDLRAQELAAMAAVLEPGLLAAAVLQPDSGERLRATKEYLESLQRDGRLVFGHKLGHGRALGLGSVTLECKAAIRWPQADGEDDPALKGRLSDLIVTHVLPMLDDTTTLYWFRALQCFGPRPGREAPLPYLCHSEPMVKWAVSQRSARIKQARQTPFVAG